MLLSRTSRKKLTTLDRVNIGVFGAIAVTTQMIVGFAAGTTLVGVILSVPIISLFLGTIYMLLAVKVKKTGVFLALGIINALPGLMVANVIGVILCIAGSFIAEYIASRRDYSKKCDLIAAYVSERTTHFAGFCLPIYLSAVSFLYERKDMFHLTEETIQEFVSYLTWPGFIGIIVLNIVTSLIGAWVGLRVLTKHFEKAGLV